MTLALELTTAELELIENKRKQESLEKEAELLKKEAKLQKDIIEVKNAILKEQKEYNDQVEAATEYHSQLVKLNPKYKLIVSERELQRDIKDYSTNPSTILQSINYKISEAHITLEDSPFKVEVSKHIVYKKWRSEDNGYKMLLTGGGFYNERLVSNTKTLNQKIKDKLQDDKYKALLSLKKANAVEYVFENLSNLYPDAEIVKGTEWQRNNWDKNRSGETIDIINIKLSNGIKIKYRVYPDRTMSRLEMIFPIKDSYQLLELMNGLTIPE
jgi:hypothetical protein